MDLGDVAFMSMKLKKAQESNVDSQVKTEGENIPEANFTDHDTFEVPEENDSSYDIEEELTKLVLPQLNKGRSVVKMGDGNLELVKDILSSDKMGLGMTLLKRLRKYKLISSTINHEGTIVVGISPKVEGRIKQTG